MGIRVQDFLGKPRNTKAETELVHRLRELDSKEAFTFICEYLDHDPVVGLELANRVLTERRQLEEILGRGFAEADASSIRFWLACCVDRVGPRRVLAMFRSLVDSDAEAARRTFYWTRIFLLRSLPELREELVEVAQRLGEEPGTTGL